MRAVIQRVIQASVIVSEKEVASIDKGILVFIGIETEDRQEDSFRLANKISKLRIFSEEDGLMNKSIKAINGDIIVVSQFTLHARTKKGNRPSFIKSARPEQAIPLYEKFKRDLSSFISKEVQSGEFGADMTVSLINDGPVTIILDTKE